MEDLQRLIQETAGCKTKIAGLEADLNHLLKERTTTDSSEALSDPASDQGQIKTRKPQTSPGGSADTSDECLSPHLAQQKKLLSASYLENARLKMAIAEKETQNAELALELNELKAKLAEAESARTEEIDGLQRELGNAKQVISGLKSKLKQARAERAENEQLKQEIQRLSNSQATTTRNLKKIIARRASNLMRTIALVESDLVASITNMDTRLAALAVPFSRPQKDLPDFMSELTRGLQAIEKLTQEYANSRTL
jgi:chromosome segregation ATPase